jgi:acetyltransferase-like isoleucine patch superfamily enzyme
LADDTGDQELVERLRHAYVAVDEQLRAQFDRSLSFQDGTFDRWERARRLGFGEQASIYNSALVYGSVSVGRESWIGPWVLLDGSGGTLEIGSFCSISAGVHVYTHDTVAWAVSGGQLPRRTGAVSIGDCCHIGAQSVVVAGVSIGDRCVVGANSLVNRDVAPGTVVAGSPARPIGHVVGEGADARLELDGPTER